MKNQVIAEVGTWLWALANLYEGNKITCKAWERGSYDGKFLPDFLRMENSIIQNYSFFDEFEWEHENVFCSYNLIDLVSIDDWYILEEVEVPFPELGIPNRTYFSDKREKEEKDQQRYWEAHPNEYKAYLLELEERAKANPFSLWTRDRLREKCVIDMILPIKEIDEYRTDNKESSS